jgi:hypothetical protein
MSKNPGVWIVVMLVVLGWNLYEIFGPQGEAPSQAVVILNWICVVCAAAGLVGGVMQLMKNQEKA